MKRAIDIVVISDLHLGTYGCHAKELLDYLKAIKPDVLVLNGDIFDIWQFNKRYFPNEHLQVINRVIKMASLGTKVYYITGNHDEKLREFSNLKLANIHILDQLELIINGKKYWFFHGDVFDISINHTKLVAKLGGLGYDTLIRLNRYINAWRTYFGWEKISFSKKVKHSVKEAVKFIQNFEELSIQAALKKEVDYVVCGHIHQPSIKVETRQNKTVTYLNSGDWVENLTALEYNFRKWSLYEYETEIIAVNNKRLEVLEEKKKMKLKPDITQQPEFEPLAIMNY
jgi:UDP-2,3-diacylglucosamine pyrophosphatase LpxH